MYGTIAKMRLKPGMHDRMLELTRKYESADVPGYRGDIVYRSDDDPDVYYLVVRFDSREAYRANAESPDQHQRYLEYREILAADPEWHDGEVVYDFRK